MGWFFLFLIIVLFAVFLRLSFKLLPIPALYMVLCWTVLSSWDSANPTWSNAIFFSLVGLNVLVWIVQIVRKVGRKAQASKRQRAIEQRMTAAYLRSQKELS